MPESRARVWGVVIRDRTTARLIFGLVVITLGVIFTLDNLGVMNARDVLRWWPAALVGYGVMRLTGFGCPRHATSGILFTIIGSWLLLHNLDVIEAGLWDMWPLILVALGVSMVVRGLSRSSVSGTGEDTSPRLNAFAMMSGTHRKVMAQDFSGGEITAVMGGHMIDLRGARLAGESAVIDVFVWWGGIELRVPPEWRVSCDALPFMAGIDDNSKAPAGEAAGHLIIKGLIVMGGVEVKN